MGNEKDYEAKRKFDETPEPSPEVRGDVNPHSARVGDSFVIHQHHATRLHFDLRLEMFNGKTPVLVSWAVPKNVPLERGKRHLAIHVEDHPFEYGRFSGSIPAGNYGAGQVRIFDQGRLEMLERDGSKLTFRLEGKRIKGVFHLIETSAKDEKWLILLSADERESPDPLPPLSPMIPSESSDIPSGKEWSYEPVWPGKRVLATLDSGTRFHGSESATGPLAKIHEQIVATDAVIDGLVMGPSLVAVDLLYLDGRSLVDAPLHERRNLLDQAVVPSEAIQVGMWEKDARALGRALESQGLSGLIAKKAGSIYEPGATAESWVRVSPRH